MSSTTNPAFAFVVTSILNSNKSAKLLSKAKKESESFTDKTTDVQNSDNNKNKESFSNQNDAAKKEKKQSESKETLKQKEVDKIFQSKLEMEDKEKEKRLTLIATKGVVQLFNVVREKQQSLKHELEEAGPSDSKRIKVLTKFKENAAAELDNTTKNNKKRRWAVLEEDYMQGSKYKDWDKEDDSD